MDAAAVLSVGMVTPVGLSAAQTMTSVRAGIARARESTILSRSLAPMVLALVPDDALPPRRAEPDPRPGRSREERCLRLAQAALAEALASLPPGRPPALFLAAPEGHDDRLPPLGADFVPRLADRSGGKIDAARSRLFPEGRAAAFPALAAAFDELRARGGPVLVGGVDTHLDLHLLGSLDREGRVLCAGVADGFVPGEGAAFLLLDREATPSGGGRAAIRRARVHPPGLAEEAGHRRSEEPYRGEGLPRAVAAALADVPGREVLRAYASLNGEHIQGKEWGVTTLRTGLGAGGGFRLIHPAECFGDAGAATGAILLGLAALELTSGHAASPVVAWASSDGPRRGAARLET
jgi:3-oxoacyl-[acyl-carrier-protein] synthase-1